MKKARIDKLEATNWCEKRSDGQHSQYLIGNSPNTSKSHTGKLQRGASRARRRLPICDHEKVWCLRCDGLTSRDSNVTCCKNCGCIFPSAHTSHNLIPHNVFKFHFRFSELDFWTLSTFEVLNFSVSVI